MTEIRENSKERLMFIETNYWYYDSYVWDNRYSAPDPNAWISNSYIGYERDPATGYYDNYDNDYNDPVAAPTHKLTTFDNQGVGGYHDEGDEVRHLNGGFRDGGAFNYDPVEDNYYRIFDDSADHVYYTLDVFTAIEVDTSKIWWWKYDFTNNEPRVTDGSLTVVAERQIDPSLDMNATDFTGFGNKNYQVVGSSSTDRATIMNGIADTALPFPTTKAELDALIAATTSYGDLTTGKSTSSVDAVPYWPPAGSGSDIDTVTLIVTPSGTDPTLLYEEMNHVFWYESDPWGPTDIDLEDLRSVNDRILADVINLSADELEASTGNTYKLNAIVEVQPRNITALLYTDTIESRSCDLSVDIIDASDDSVFKTIDLTFGTTNPNYGLTATIDGVSWEMDGRLVAVTAAYYTGESLFVRVSDGIVSLNVGGTGIHRPRIYSGTPYSDDELDSLCENGWADWHFSSATTFPASFKLRYRATEPWASGEYEFADGINESDCATHGCETTVKRCNAYCEVDNYTGNFLGSPDPYTLQNTPVKRTMQSECSVYQQCVDQFGSSTFSPGTLTTSVTFSGQPDSATVNVLLTSSLLAGTGQGVSTITYEKTGVDISADSTVLSFTYASDMISETNNFYLPNTIYEIDFDVTVSQTGANTEL